MISLKVKIYAILVILGFVFIAWFVYRGNKIDQLSAELTETKDLLEDTQKRLTEKNQITSQYLIEKDNIQKEVDKLNQKLKEVQDNEKNQEWLKEPIPVDVDDTIPY